MKLNNNDNSLNDYKRKLAYQMFGDSYINTHPDNKIVVLHQIIWELINEYKTREAISNLDAIKELDICEHEMKKDNPFCEACKEKHCTVGLDSTCSLIRVYLKAKDNENKGE